MASLVAALVLLLFAAGVLFYNRLVRARNRVDTAWSDIDVQLVRRHDLVPRLVEAVRQYAAYEKATLEAVTALRTEAMQTADIGTRGEVEQRLASGVNRLIALAEAFPDLKASASFLDLQTQLVETENYLQFARRFYNGSVRDYNILIESVPSNIVAGLFGFSARPFFQKASDDVANVPLIGLGSVE
jgi:LemA protein